MAAPAESQVREVRSERVSSACDHAGELLRRIAVRDADAFEELYQRYARPVFALTLRRLRDRGHAEDAVQDVFAPDQVSAEPEPAAAIEASMLAFRVHAAVSELPEPERAVLELAYWRGRSQSEIARLLGIPLGTVKTRTSAGLRGLAATLDGRP